MYMNYFITQRKQEVMKRMTEKNLNEIKRTILYVEDDPDDQEIFREALAKVSPGTICCVASNANEALLFLNERDRLVDIIFLDINLPGMNGIAFLEMIKNDNRLKDIPTVMCSTANEEKYIDQCKELGALSFIVKPNSFLEICNILKRHCAPDFAVLNR